MIAARLSRITEALPSGSSVTLPVDEIRGWLDGEQWDSTPVAATTPASSPVTWRERIWLVPEDTRIGVEELTEAVGRSKHWVYRHTSRGTIPHRKFDGALVFVVGEVRSWLLSHEAVVAAPVNQYGRRRVSKRK